MRLNHNYVGTEHLLLGLVREGDGVGPMVLTNLGVDLEKIRSAVESLIGRGDRAVFGEIGLTASGKKAINTAANEARKLRHRYVGTEHLLLALASDRESVGGGVLEALGVSPDKVRPEIRRILSAPVPPRRKAGPSKADLQEAVWDTSGAYADAQLLRNLLVHRRFPVAETSREMVVTPIFRWRNYSTGENRCFVLMPFAPEFRPIYDDHIKKAIEECRLFPVRTDDVFSPGEIMEQIWAEINRARLIIADVTHKKPNVFYELGIAHTVGKSVIIITQSEEDVPFDLRHLRYIKYEYTPRGCKALEVNLKQAILAVLQAEAT